MANTFQLISSATVGSGGASSIDFTSIPSTYTDLVLHSSLRNSGTNTDCYLLVNGSNGSDKWLYAQGSSPGSTNGSKIYVESAISSQTTSTFSNSQIYIPNYTNGVYKNFAIDTITENNSSTGNLLLLSAGLWSSGSAITSLSITVLAGSFVQYSTAYLYGIKNS